MNDAATHAAVLPPTETANLISRFVRPADLPARGAAIVEIVRARRVPDRLVAALERLTPAKVFHNVYEVWFDTVGHGDRRTATTTGEAAVLAQL